MTKSLQKFWTAKQTNPTNSSPPDVLNYNDFRHYLRDYYDYTKSLNPNFSYQNFAVRAGFTAKSYMANILAGRKDLSLTGIQRISKGLGFKPQESEYFEALVLYNQSKELEAKFRLFQRLQRLSAHRPQDILTPQEHALYSDWLRVVLLELSEITSIQMNKAKELGARIFPPQTETNVQKSLKWLLEYNFLSDTHGQLRKTRRSYQGDCSRLQPQVRAFQQQMAKIAEQNMGHFKPEEQFASTLTFSVAQEDLACLISEIQRMRNEFSSLLHNRTNPKRVYHLNIQLFPLDKGTPDA